MYKLSYVYIMLLTISISCNHITFSMYNLIPLSDTEKEIFLQKVRYSGIESIAKQLAQERARDYFCFSIEFKFYPKESNDQFTHSILQKIAEKEHIYGYLPHGKVDTISGELIQATNFLGYYTRYWHGSDEKGNYITCTSTFTRKEVLERALKDIKKAHCKSNL